MRFYIGISGNGSALPGIGVKVIADTDETWGTFYAKMWAEGSNVFNESGPTYDNVGPYDEVNYYGSGVDDGTYFYRVEAGRGYKQVKFEINYPFIIIMGGNNFPEERPLDYDSDLVWAYNAGTDTWEWQDVVVAGGGRYNQQIVAIGQGDANQGVIYFGEV